MIKVTLIYKDNTEIIELAGSSMDNETEDRVKQYLLSPTRIGDELEKEDQELYEILGVGNLIGELIDVIRGEIAWVTNGYTDSEMFRVTIEN